MLISSSGLPRCFMISLRNKNLNRVWYSDKNLNRVWFIDDNPKNYIYILFACINVTTNISIH